MSIIEQAVKHFNDGRYEQAKIYFELASKEYGCKYFEANISLCDIRIKTEKNKNNHKNSFNLKKIFLKNTPVNTFKSVDPFFIEKIKIEENISGKIPLDMTKKDYKFQLKSWIDDAEDISIGLSLVQSGHFDVVNSLGIIKFNFFNNNGEEILAPGLTNLSWSDHLNCWYFYLNGTKNIKTTLVEVNLIKPQGVAYIEISCSKWKIDEFSILNEVIVKRKPSILQVLRKNYAGILSELNNPVVKHPLSVNKSKVCYVLNQSLPYQSEGYATRSHALASAMKNQGLDIVCLSRPGYPESFLKDYKEKNTSLTDDIDGIHYQRLKEPKGWKGTENYITKASNELERKFKELRPSCVMAASDFKNALPALLAAKRLGIPFIYEVRGFWEITHESKQPTVVQTANYHLTQYLETELALHADYVFTLTEAMRTLLISRGLEANKVALLPNSCDVSKFNPLENPKDYNLLEQLNIPENTPTIGYIGTFNSYEGLDDLLHACGALYNEGINFRIILVGATPSTDSAQGQYALELLNIAKQYGFDKWLIMPGRIPHDAVKSYYSIIDVAPFTRKPLPITELVSPLKPLEAMAMGKALVVSSVGALGEMVKDGETGLVYEKGNVEDLANKLLSTLVNSSLRISLGAAARNWAVTERTWEICAARIQEKISELEKNIIHAYPSINTERLLKKKASDYKVAFIADEFTYNSFKDEFQAIVIEPDNWEKLFKEQQPDIFFCESAWSGVDSVRRPWQGKIYSSINWKKENRTILFKILDYCRDNNIPTIFWNKEDPTHFTDRVHDFIGTASKFDYVFTTAEECCESYKSDYGVKNVFSLPFATNPKLFNPINRVNAENKVVFAGSWYANHEQRSIVMEQILDNLIKTGYELEIVDRYYGGSDELHKWPEKYSKFLKPGMPHDKMPEVYRSSTLGLNFNTVVNSETMFARRVFELMSSKSLVISNYSLGIDKMFGELVVFADRDPERLKKLSTRDIELLSEKALDNVLRNHTYTNRWKQILTKIGMPWIPDTESVTIVSKVSCKSDVERSISYFQSNYANQIENKLLLLVDEKVGSLEVAKFYQQFNKAGVMVTSMKYIETYSISDKYNPITTDYFIICSPNNLPKFDWVKKAKLHSQYVEGSSITHHDSILYRYVENSKCNYFFSKKENFIELVKAYTSKTSFSYSV
ncbi:glycosyltransferase [Acinetobacter rudis]|uniref:Glycosyl transferase family 1 domain-containing protein n=1 Tax=Acinetobacter rudis CIP 110305 TaxID=421052 RepID=S3N6T2_9GAMM|nr:glycosyltransferase [Acinetobacter rudis]EPF69979.1 hypothetical protein F945_03543 [Acinetobacter rudis CIP 110305]